MSDLYDERARDRVFQPLVRSFYDQPEPPVCPRHGEVVTDAGCPECEGLI